MRVTVWLPIAAGAVWPKVPGTAGRAQQPPAPLLLHRCPPAPALSRAQRGLLPEEACVSLLSGFEEQHGHADKRAVGRDSAPRHGHGSPHIP